MVRAQARLEPRRPRSVPEDAQLLVGKALGVLLAAPSDLGSLLGAGEMQPVRQALGDGIVTGGPGEDEDDGGQHGQVVERFDELAPTRPHQTRVAHAAGAPGQARHALVEGQRLGVDLAVVQQGHELDAAAPLLGDGHVIAQLDGPMRLDDHLGRTAHGTEPGAELVGVGNRRRQAHEHHVGSRQDYHLLPHRPPIGILEVVDLVQHDQAQALQLGGAGEEHVAQDLGRHHDHRRVGPVRDVTGEQPHRVGPVHLGQLRVLLVGQRLERRRVKGALTPGPGARHGVVGHDGLARAGRSRHQHRAALVQGVAGGGLEGVEREPESRHHLGPQRVADSRARHRARWLNGARTSRSGSTPRRRRTSAPPAPAWRTGPRWE